MTIPKPKETLEEAIARTKKWAEATHDDFLKRVEAANASLPEGFVWPNILIGSIKADKE